MIGKQLLERGRVWGPSGLVPSVVQDAADGRVLMVGVRGCRSARGPLWPPATSISTPALATRCGARARQAGTCCGWLTWLRIATATRSCFG